jgi:uncharacterized protein GlcG (DUF336 family)
MELDYSKASSLIDVALSKATELGCAVSVAVLDGGRELLAFARQDGAVLLSAEASQGKAFAARSMNMATIDMGALTQPGQPLYGLETAVSRPVVTFGGGRPLTIGEAVVGAIGVAGGTVEQDNEIALAAAESLQQ